MKTIFGSGVFLFACILLSAGNSSGQTQVNSKATGNWGTSSTWSPAVIPNNGGGNTYNVTILNSPGMTITLDISPTINSLTVDQGSALSTISGKTLTTNGVTNAGRLNFTNGNTFTANGLTTNTGVLFLANSSTGIFNGDLSNSGTIQTSSNGKATISGIFTNNAGAFLALASAGDVVNINSLTNKGRVDISGGATLNLTGGGQGITAVAAGSQFNVSGTLNVINGGTPSNALANLTTVAGALAWENGQTLTDTPTGGTLSVGGQLFIGNGSTFLVSNLNNTGTFQTSNKSKATISGMFTNNASAFLSLASAGDVVNISTLTNNSRIDISSGATLTLTGATSSNSKVINLNGGGILKISAPNVSLSGGGTVTLNSGFGPPNIIEGAAGADTLTNVNNTIQGTGNIGNNSMALNNQGTIDANLPGFPLTIQTSNGTTNSGILEATNGATLFLKGGTVTNSLTGSIKAAGAGSTVQLVNGVAVAGGTLSDTTGGMIETPSLQMATLDTVTIAGTYAAMDNSTTTLKGTINNGGTISVNSTGNKTELLIGAASVTLSGAGNLVLSNNANNIITGAAATDMLTNASTIQGAGNIGNGNMGLVNTGTIIANQPTELFIKPSVAGAFNNTGTLTVNAGSTLDITGGTFKNFNSGSSTLTGGSYKVTGTLQFDSAKIITNAANITLTGAASQIVNQASANALASFATNAAGANFGLAGGRNFTTAANFTNNGTLTAGTGTKFTVNGNLTNFAGTTLTGGTYAVSGTLQFNGANIVTNAANITLTGAASQIINQSSVNALANFATNSGSFTLAGSRNFTTTGSFINSGAMNILNGTTFAVGGAGNFTQTAGTTTADGKLMTAGAINIQGGTVFGNNGTLTGNFSLTGGTLAPGDGFKKAGDLNITGAYSQGASGALTIDLGGTTPNATYDVLNISSTASLNGALNVDLIGGFTPTVGSSFNIVNYSSETGTFKTLNLPTVTGDHWTVVYKAKDVVLTLVAGAGPTVLDHAPLNLQSSSMSAISASRKQSASALAEEPYGMMTDGTCGGLRTFTSFSCIAKAISGHTSIAGIPPAQSQRSESKSGRGSVAIASSARTRDGGGHTPSAAGSASRLNFCAFVPSVLASSMGCEVADAYGAQPRTTASSSVMGQRRP